VIPVRCRRVFPGPFAAHRVGRACHPRGPRPRRRAADAGEGAAGAAIPAFRGRRQARAGRLL